MLTKLHTLTLFCGIISVVMAVVVIFGWYTHNQLLVQVHPSFAPMQFNTAVAFLSSGLGLIFLLLRLDGLVKLSSLFVFALGLLTIIQYYFHVDFKIDNIFVEPVYLTKTSHPGRMAPLTALCFSLYGIMLLTSSTKKAVAIGLCSTLFALSTIALLGYLTEYETLYGWGNLTRMAIHTASCFFILSVGVFAFHYYRIKIHNFDIWQLAPAIVSILVAVLTIFAGYILEEEAKARNQAYFSQLIDKTQDSVMDRYTIYEESLRGGLGLFYASKSVEREEWRKYVEALELQTYLPGIRGVGYIDHVYEKDLEAYIEREQNNGIPDFINHPETKSSYKYIIRYIEPIEDNLEAVGLDIAFEKNRRDAAQYARDFATPTITNKIYLVQNKENQAGFLMMIPVYNENITPKTIRERKNNIKGWVYAPFDASTFFQGVHSVNSNQLNFTVYDGDIIEPNDVIYMDVNTGIDKSEIANLSATTSLNIAGKIWTFAWHANNNYLPPSSRYYSQSILVLGFILSMLLFFSINRLVQTKSIIGKTVNKRTKELQEANEELKEFSYRTSHDLRSPLISSIGLLKVVQDALDKDNKEIAQKSAAHVQYSLEKLDTLVQDILILTKATNAEEELQDTNSEEVIEEALHKMSHMDNFEKLTVLKALAYPDNIHLKKSRLVLIIENLISNAIKYQDLSKDNSFIKLSTYRERDDFIFEIEDNGLGIPKEQQHKLFVMFKRFHDRVAFGSGLGLYMTKKCAHILGGDLTFEDNIDRTIFRLNIPET